MKKPEYNSGFCYPVDLIKNLHHFPSQHAIPCSVLFNDDPKGGIVIICPPSDLKFFGIDPSNQPQPSLRFRMLNIEKKAFAIEIHLVYEDDRILKIHLNPAVNKTRPKSIPLLLFYPNRLPFLQHTVSRSHRTCRY